VSVCPSVSLSHQSKAAAACGGFAAEYAQKISIDSAVRSAAAATQLGPQHGAQQQIRAMSF